MKRGGISDERNLSTDSRRSIWASERQYIRPYEWTGENADGLNLQKERRKISCRFFWNSTDGKSGTILTEFKEAFWSGGKGTAWWICCSDSSQGTGHWRCDTARSWRYDSGGSMAPSWQALAQAPQPLHLSLSILIIFLIILSSVNSI